LLTLTSVEDELNIIYGNRFASLLVDTNVFTGQQYNNETTSKFSRVRVTCASLGIIGNEVYGILLLHCVPVGGQHTIECTTYPVVLSVCVWICRNLLTRPVSVPLRLVSVNLLFYLTRLKFERILQYSRNCFSIIIYARINVIISSTKIVIIIKREISYNFLYNPHFLHKNMCNVRRCNRV